jgi:hypothetical protein
MPTPTIKASANLAIVWGTANSANAGNGVLPTGAIIETLTVTPKNGDPIDIEDGDGYAAAQAMINDGFNAKASVVYDANKAMPTEGQNIVLVVPRTDGNSGTRNVNCTFWSWGFTKSRKKEKMVELNFTHRPGINT